MSTESYNPNKQETATLSPEQLLGKLHGAMDMHSQDVNKEAGFELLDNKAQVNPEALGGLSEKDSQTIAKIERGFAKIDDPDARATFRRVYHQEHLTEAEMDEWMMTHWREAKEKDKNTKLEMLVTLIFRKVLGEDYLVMRASVYDDYANGVDNIIVNKKTGQIICAFDDVHDRKEGESLAAKNAKIIEKAKLKKDKKGRTVSGGTNLKYAVTTTHDGKIMKASFSNIPIFYVAMVRQDLETAFSKIDWSNPDKASAEEHAIFGKFASGILQQAEMLLQQAETDPALKPRLLETADFFKEFSETEEKGEAK